MDEHISTFVAITGATADIARGFLQITNGEVEPAVGLYFENPDLASGVGAGVTGSGGGSETALPPAARTSNIGRQDASGVIHISDDEDDDVMHIEDDEDESGADERAAVEQAAALAQEEEDAAMAKRLQEELYQGGSGPGGAGPNDDVRAPIARTTETLVAPDMSWDGGMDEESTHRLLEQLRGRRHPPRKYRHLLAAALAMQQSPLT